MSDRTQDLRAPIPIGDGLSLRRWRDQDAQAIAEACSDPEIARWIPVPQPYTVEAARRYIELSDAWWRARERFVLCIDQQGQAVGSISLRLDGVEPSIGYWLARQARGAGIMTRAVNTVTAWASSTLGLREVWIYAQPENTASRAVAQRAGFTERERRTNFPDGRQRVVYHRQTAGVTHG